jgi:hypothetical protein
MPRTNYKAKPHKKSPPKKSPLKKSLPRKKSVPRKIQSASKGHTFDKNGVIGEMDETNRNQALSDIDAGKYGDIYATGKEPTELSTWSDYKKHDNIVPDTIINAFFEKAFQPYSADSTLHKNGLVYEEMRYKIKHIMENMCLSIARKIYSTSKITPTIVMLCVNILPLQSSQTEPVIPISKLKEILDDLMRDYAHQHTFEQDSIQLIHTIIEHHVLSICQHAIGLSRKHNFFVQPFHVQYAARLCEPYNPVPFSSNSLCKAATIDFTDAMKKILYMVTDPKSEISMSATHQLNRFFNALVAKLVDIYAYYKNLRKEKAIETTVGSLIPGELGKHAISEGGKAVSGSKLVLMYDNDKLEQKVVLFIRGVIEYLMAEILELSDAQAKDAKEIDVRHIKAAIEKDEELSDFLRIMNLYFVL